jgi:hypothetical protein
MVVYHATNIENIYNILKYGLKTNFNSKNGWTAAGEWADQYYGKRPIYVSLDKYDGIQLEINIDDGIYLFPDLPSLIDYGAYLVTGEGLYWEEGEEPEELIPFLQEGEISFDELLNNPLIAKAVINLTRTAAIYQDIPPEKITVIMG